MEKNTKKEESAQGAKTLTEDDFKTMVTRDLQTSYSLLNAVLQDAPTLTALNEFLYGRYLNQVHKAELEKQTKIDA